MEKGVFEKEVGEILGIKQGQVEFAGVHRVMASDNGWRIDVRVIPNDKQIAKLRDLIIRNGT